MRRLRASVDFDCTLARTNDLVAELMNFRLGTTHLRPENWTRWDFFSSKEEEDAFWAAYDLMDRHGLRMCIRPQDAFTGNGLRWVVKTMDTTVVTGNHPSVASDIARWLRDVLLFHHPLPVRCIGRPGTLSPQAGGSKLDLPFDVYLDDAPSIAAKIEQYPAKFLLLADAPWNREVPEGPQVRRFRSWAEVPALLATASEHVRRHT